MECNFGTSTSYPLPALTPPLDQTRLRSPYDLATCKTCFRASRITSGLLVIRELPDKSLGTISDIRISLLVPRPPSGSNDRSRFGLRNGD